MARILVTPRSVTARGHPSLHRLIAAGHEVVLGPAGRQPSEADLHHLLPGCAGYLAGVETISARVLTAAQGSLKVISRNGTGVDTIDLAAAQRLGISVLAAAGANARGVAELTLGLLFALARGIPASASALSAGQWTRTAGFEVEGRTLGVFGFGNVGRRVAQMALSLGMNVCVFDPFLPPDSASEKRLRATPDSTTAEPLLLSLEDVLTRAEILTLHCPPPADGSTLLDAARISQMRRGIHLINTARAELVDEAALLDALHTGQIAGFAVDVFREEPPAPDSALLRHPRVIATPHIGGFTQESIDRAMDAAVDNLLSALAHPR